MNKELVEKAHELEQTLKMQLDIVRKESSDYVKVGGAVLAGSIIAFTAFKIFGSKQNKKTKKVLDALEKQGLLDDEIKDKLTRKRQPGLLGRLGTILLPLAVNYGREQLLNRLNEPKNKSEEDAK